jgi:hypothetical protein
VIDSKVMQGRLERRTPWSAGPGGLSRVAGPRNRTMLECRPNWRRVTRSSRAERSARSTLRRAMSGPGREACCRRTGQAEGGSGAAERPHREAKPAPRGADERASGTNLFLRRPRCPHRRRYSRAAGSSGKRALTPATFAVRPLPRHSRGLALGLGLGVALALALD